MAISWTDLTFEPDSESVRALTEAWSWLLEQPYTPLLFSTLGDMFYLNEADEVYWLNTGTGQLENVASSKAEFLELLKTDVIDEWFLPPLIESLKNAGKHLAPGQCYTYVTLPIFKEGKYIVDNLNPVSAAEHFSLTGHIHSEIRDPDDGAKVKVRVDE
jgi:hypothetical protein